MTRHFSQDELSPLSHPWPELFSWQAARVCYLGKPSHAEGAGNSARQRGRRRKGGWTHAVISPWDLYAPRSGSGEDFPHLISTSL